MRLIHLFVPDEQNDAVFDTLDEMGVDYATSGSSESQADRTLVQFPLPTNAVEPVVAALRDAGVDTDSYTVIDTAETAMTPGLETLQEEYSQDYTPLAPYSLRSKALDMSHDTLSYVVLVLLSAVIAAAGLLVDSPAIVVGSMVIAPLVGPMLTAGVGTATGDREMIAASLRQQAVGITVGIAGAAVVALSFRALGIVAGSLDPTSLELVTLRMAPGVVALLVGVAGGAAAAIGLTTHGPISIIGVMIAAALVPAAAVVGIGIAWGAPVLTVGALLLLLSTLVVVNASIVVTLFFVGYRSDAYFVERSPAWNLRTVATAALVVALLVASVGASAAQLQYERDVNDGVEAVLERPTYDEVSLAGVSTPYANPLLFDRPTEVTVTIERPAGRSYPALPDALETRVEARTGSPVTLRVEHVTYTTPARTTDSVAIDLSADTERSRPTPG
ncbi:TIGR00341 family protein [Salinigranum sp.]|uniref:TIGR00341 family protein n=1 Tax=Salinigranum sp. TaxID=1966351 RepID=UPI0035673E22